MHVAVYVDGHYWNIVNLVELTEIAEVFEILHFDANYREVYL